MKRSYTSPILTVVTLQCHDAIVTTSLWNNVGLVNGAGYDGSARAPGRDFDDWEEY